MHHVWLQVEAAAAQPRGEAVALVLRAAEVIERTGRPISGPWTPETHQFFPAEARARAVPALLVYRHVCEALALGDNEQVALRDAWLVGVMPHAME